jgi:RNA polymerase sigma-70 factor (ECF subfamily)
MGAMNWIFRRQGRRPANDQKADELLGHLDAAYMLARYLTHDECGAEDAVLDAFLGATGCGVGTDTADARVSVLTFVRNACLERNSRDQLTARWESRPRPPDRNAPSLDHSLYSLAPEFREVLLLREGCELSYSQISKVVNAPVGLVVSRLSRARIRLHEKLLSRRESEIRSRCPAE